MGSVAVEQARANLLDIFNASAESIDWLCGFEELDVSKLDSDRDFHCSGHLGTVLYGLSMGDLPPQAKSTCSASAKGPHAFMIRVGRRWQCQLYAKQAQVRTLPKSYWEDPLARMKAIDDAEEVLRFECRTFRPVNREKQIAKVADLTSEKVTEVNRYFFERCLFDRPVGGAFELREIVMSMLGEPDCRRSVPMVLGHLQLERLGLTSPSSPNTRTKVRKLTNRFSLSSKILEPREGSRVRLDYDSGVAVSEPESLIPWGV
jgi:hypothetical protein